MQEKRQITSRRVAHALIVILVASASILADDSRAQISSVWAPSSMDTGTSTNVFVAWDGLYPLDGVQLDLDSAVTLERSAFTCSDKAPITNREGDTRYRILAPETIRGNCNIVLTVNSGSAVGEASLVVQPILPDEPRWSTVESNEVAHSIDVRRTLVDQDNRVGTFSESFARAVPLDTPAHLDIRRSYTIELWIQTTAVGSVVLSSWDGVEATAYPVELIIEPAGRLVFFTGQQGLHESMSSPRPVADGRWHHVAVSNDSKRNVVSLNIDGVRVDSLRLSDPGAARSGSLFLGGRSTNRSEGVNVFRGQMDGVRVWNVARTESEIAAARFRSGVESSAVVATMEFDSDERSTETDGIITSLSTLEFTRPIEEINVVTNDRDITLSWVAPSMDVSRFVVEESTDGLHFDEIGEVRVGQVDGAQSYSFTAYDVQGGVAYYRIRQVFADESTRSSNIVKVGLGESLVVPEIHFSNFPNPFSRSTRISYEVSEQAPVSLTVWDIAGQAVARLVDEVQPTGIHEAEFDASELPSGIYFVRLEIGNLVMSRKVTVAR